MTEDQAFIEWKAEQYKHQSTEEEMEFVEHLHYFPRYFEKTFIDGYRECQKEHEWHDLRKDPKDVPDEGTYLIEWRNARGYGDTMIMRYEEDDEEELHWIDRDGDNWDDDVIAWREIPKFEEIEK
jgi:hypothetical protein